MPVVPPVPSSSWSTALATQLPFFVSTRKNPMHTRSAEKEDGASGVEARAKSIQALLGSSFRSTHMPASSLSCFHPQIPMHAHTTSSPGRRIAGGCAAPGGRGPRPRRALTFGSGRGGGEAGGKRRRAYSPCSFVGGRRRLLEVVEGKNSVVLEVMTKPQSRGG